MFGVIVIQSCGSFLSLSRPKTDQRKINDENNNFNSLLSNFKVALINFCPLEDRKTSRESHTAEILSLYNAVMVDM